MAGSMYFFSPIFDLPTSSAVTAKLMAVSTVYSIPPVVLYYVFKRYLVSGLVSGAVSGT